MQTYSLLRQVEQTVYRFEDFMTDTLKRMWTEGVVG
jgi:hypothetical protein